MMKRFAKVILYLLAALLTAILANSVILTRIWKQAWFLVPCIPLYISVNIIPSFFHRDKRTVRLRQMAYGCELLRIFLLSTVFTAVFVLTGWMGGLPGKPPGIGIWISHILLAVLIEAVVFWNGIVRIYLTSTQLGIRWRVLGAVCGMIPIVNLVLLGILLHTAEREVCFENQKLLLNEQRADEQICKTRYPILMVHGVFFRDFRYFNYWGRIPGELTKNGATVFYGNHQSAASVEECGKELAERIRQIVQETGCEKVNLIAHSKGGLDCRYAISGGGADKYVASLTTINTPHRGCEFADYLLLKIPDKQKEMVACTYNAALHKLGDTCPDFLEAVYDLTADACRKRNEELKDVPGIFYQSVGSKLNMASGGRFPLNFTHYLVRYFDGDNDGLVGEKSFPWGEKYQFLTVKGKRGISHGDMIDLNRENFEGFDVREFFVQLVWDLKRRGF